eukprot:TRINITY_DN23556_c0_g1_i1.p1 TRINITY_DN23556_c0_g1~~TRINITY_DN23556_c0_g1_i1.p1  ORF type:complete len:123 (-),score=21.78 TRINITY_DN23556_c0_g1_i1:113-481(-)
MQQGTYNITSSLVLNGTIALYSQMSHITSGGTIDPTKVKIVCLDQSSIGITASTKTTLTDFTISSCFTGLLLKPNASVTANSLIITNNRNTGGGAGVSVSANSSLAMTSSQISFNNVDVFSN